MGSRRIQLEFDKEAVWRKVEGRLSVFLDTNCWIDMADEVNSTACRVRDRLKALVESGKVFCPLSWGILEELFKQSGESCKLTSVLMEELSLNAIFVMRTELYQWELSRSIRRALGELDEKSRSGLFAPPAAFVGTPALNWKADAPLNSEAIVDLKRFMRDGLSKIGVAELAGMMMGRSKPSVPPPAYSEAAKKAKERLKGNKKKLFLMEAEYSFITYIRPTLFTYPQSTIAAWTAKFGPPTDEYSWMRNALEELPALQNFVDIMVVADMQPDRKDSNNHFLDNEIMVAPLAYATVFASKDKGIRDLLQHRAEILSKRECEYCDSLESLEKWLDTRFGDLKNLDAGC